MRERERERERESERERPASMTGLNSLAGRVSSRIKWYLRNDTSQPYFMGWSLPGKEGPLRSDKDK